MIRIKNIRSILLGILLASLIGCTTPPPFEAEYTPPTVPNKGQWQEGTAIWYGQMFHGRRTSNGEVFDMRKYTASHGSLPFGAKVEVTSPVTNKTVVVIINDRSNLNAETDIVLSRAAAEGLGLVDRRRFAVKFKWIE